MADHNDTIYHATKRNIAERQYGYDLVFVDHSDQLMDEQIEALFSDDPNTVYDSVDEAFWEQRTMTAIEEARDAVRETITSLTGDLPDIDEDELLDDFEASDLFEEVRFLIEERDTSDPVKDLARRTSDPLVQYVPASPIEVNFGFPDSDYDEDDIEPALTALGLKATDGNVKALREGLDNCHGYATIRAIFTVDLAQLLDGNVTELRVEDPTLLCLNPYDGSGMDTDNVDGTITVPRDRIALDSALGYGSWDNIAGVHVPAYTVPVDYVKGA